MDLTYKAFFPTSCLHENDVNILNGIVHGVVIRGVQEQLDKQTNKNQALADQLTIIRKISSGWRLGVGH